MLKLNFNVREIFLKILNSVYVWDIVDNVIDFIYSLNNKKKKKKPNHRFIPHNVHEIIEIMFN